MGEITGLKGNSDIWKFMDENESLCKLFWRSDWLDPVPIWTDWLTDRLADYVGRTVGLGGSLIEQGVTSGLQGMELAQDWTCRRVMTYVLGRRRPAMTCTSDLPYMSRPQRRRLIWLNLVRIVTEFGVRSIHPLTCPLGQSNLLFEDEG